MQDNYTTKGKHLTIDSRRLIERWKKEGKSNREIASLLGKAPQTIHTEIKRGTVRQCLGKGRFKEVYSADYAQQSYENNRKRSVKKSSLTKELKEKLLKLSTLKSSVGQSDNVLEKGASKRFILPTMLNSLMKTIASARSRNQA
ncbi:IS1239, transposase [Streptococcus pneumoniae]|nr:IS1239, transposase [Streptococcus pneumoniae]